MTWRLFTRTNNKMLVPHLLITEPSPVKSGRKAKAITKQVCYRPPAMKFMNTSVSWCFTGFCLTAMKHHETAGVFQPPFQWMKLEPVIKVAISRIPHPPNNCDPIQTPRMKWALHQNVGNIKQSRKSFPYSITTIAYATLKLQSNVVCSSVLTYSFATSCL